MRSSILLSFGRGTSFYYSVGAYYYFVGEHARDIFDAGNEEDDAGRGHLRGLAITFQRGAVKSRSTARLKQPPLRNPLHPLLICRYYPGRKGRQTPRVHDLLPPGNQGGFVVRNTECPGSLIR